MPFFIIERQASVDVLAGLHGHPVQEEVRPSGMMRLQQDLGVVKLARDSEQLGGDPLCVRMVCACRVEDPQTHQRLYELDRALELSSSRATAVAGSYAAPTSGAAWP